MKRPVNLISTPASDAAGQFSFHKLTTTRALHLSLHNILAISLLCSYNYVTAEYIALNKPQDQSTHLKQQEESSAASFASSYTQLNSKCDNPCVSISSYSLQTLPQTNCRDYVLCQDYQETYRYSCPDRQKFDGTKKKCVEGDVICRCEDTLTIESEAEAICLLNKGGSGRHFPVRDCREYVTCRRDGTVKDMSSCQEGHLFDSTLGQCDRQDRVKCTLADAVQDAGTDAVSEGTSSNFGALSFGNQISNVDNGAQPNVQDMKEKSDEITAEDSIYCAQTAGSNYAIVPLPECKQFVSCLAGKVVQKQTCAEGLIFDDTIGGCNWNYLAVCNVFYPPSKAPTKRPTFAPTVPPPTRAPVTWKPTIAGPTNLPTAKPVPQTSKPTVPLTFPPITDSPTSSDAFPKVLDWISDHVTELNQEVFRSYSREGLSYRSYWFQYSDFMDALKLMSEKSITGDKKHIFYLGNTPPEWEYGLVNVAAFLSQAMTESISKDACDEYNWEVNSDDFSNAEGENGGKPDEHYATSNACGQGGLNYQEFHCDAEESHMECSVDRNMKIQATTSEVYPNAPPPLTCRPRTTTDSFTGFWDVMTGKENAAFPYENSFGRTDVEGCCL
jgi:hypothetical protein